MKSKLVLWGSNAQDEKIMIAVALRADDNKVDIWTFPESIATEDFYQQMMKEWRDGAGMEFPEPFTHIERELSVTDSLLPDDIKVERSDVVQRAQTEWHFLVLSSKLHQAYEDQVQELKEQVEKLKDFDNAVWDNLKEFWDKVQEQVHDRNLLRDHADKLRDNINVLFGKMKELRSKADEEFERFSKDTYDKFLQALDNVEKKVEEGARLPVMFDELKKLQRKFRESRLTRDHRTKVWEKLDATFKMVKEKRFGNKEAAVEAGSSAYVRMQHRYNGLVSAIDKMEQSIKRDRNDLNFQQHKIATTDGQLEAQIRQAKILMIEERVRSKEDKLNEMNTTRADLEKRLVSLKEKEARQAAQEAVKEKIAEEIKHAAEVREEEMPELEKAAEEIKEAQARKTAPKKETAAPKQEKKEDSIMDAIGATLGESVEDFVDSVKAVASVLGDKIGDAIEELKEDLKEKKEEMAATSDNGEKKGEASDLDNVVGDAAAVDAVVTEQFDTETSDEEKA